MSKIRLVAVSVLAGVVVTLLLYLLGVLLSGGGHSYVAMMIFFPFLMIADFTLAPPPGLFLPALMIQYPLYSLLLALPRNKRKLYAAIIVLLEAVS